VLHTCLRLLSAALLFVSCASPAWAADAKELFEAREFSAGDKKLLYRIMLPQDYDASRKYPLVLFLHGAGERGDDNTVQLVHGMNDFAKDENREKYPCFVVAPQCPTGQQWANIDRSADKLEQAEQPSETMQLTLDLLAALQKDYSIDNRRLYVTGLSMGGYGTWDVIQRLPGKFAAAAPICGGGDESRAAKLVKLPIWAFHGDQDTAVKPEYSRQMIAAIKKAGGDPKYTEYEGVGHDSWVKAYSDPELMKWMFAQKRDE
jgi:predicted peptidase